MTLNSSRGDCLCNDSLLCLQGQSRCKNDKHLTTSPVIPSFISLISYSTAPNKYFGWVHTQCPQCMNSHFSLSSTSITNTESVVRYQGTCLLHTPFAFPLQSHRNLSFLKQQAYPSTNYNFSFNSSGWSLRFRFTGSQ